MIDKFQDEADKLRDPKEWEKFCLNLVQYYKCDGCTDAFCCKIIPAALSPGESELLAGFFGLTLYEFEGCYTDGAGKLVAPCKFYKDDRCQIYEIRPKTCRRYPFSATPGMIEAIDSCPMARRIYEDAEKVRKKILGPFGFLSKSKPVGPRPESFEIVEKHYYTPLVWVFLYVQKHSG